MASDERCGGTPGNPKSVECNRYGHYDGSSVTSWRHCPGCPDCEPVGPDSFGGSPAPLNVEPIRRKWEEVEADTKDGPIAMVYREAIDDIIALCDEVERLRAEVQRLDKAADEAADVALAGKDEARRKVAEVLAAADRIAEWLAGERDEGNVIDLVADYREARKGDRCHRTN